MSQEMRLDDEIEFDNPTDHTIVDTPKILLKKRQVIENEDDDANKDKTIEKGTN